jgi:hypothetical protein
MSFANISESIGLSHRQWMAWAQQFQLYGALLAIAIAITLFFKGNHRVSGILAAWPFFTRRYDFLKSNFEKTGQQMFSFNVLQVRTASGYALVPNED